MKSIQRLFFALALVFFVPFLVTGCGGDTEETSFSDDGSIDSRLIGRWETVITDEDTGIGLTVTMTFYEDGTYTGTFLGITATTTWGASNGVLQFISPSGGIERHAYSIQGNVLTTRKIFPDRDDSEGFRWIRVYGAYGS